MSVFCFFSSIAVHCYAHSYSAVAESFPTTESTSGSVLIIVVENKLVFGQEGF